VHVCGRPNHEDGVGQPGVVGLQVRVVLVSAVAGEFDADKIMQNFDLDEALRDFFQNNSFSIRP
jgi:hypothetical protein